MVVGIFGQNPLLSGFGITGLHCVGKIVKVGTCLPNEFEAGGLAMAGMKRLYTSFREILEFIESREPAHQMPLLQIQMRLVVNQIRGEKRLHLRNEYGSNMFGFALPKFSHLELNAIHAQTWFNQNL